MTEPLTLAQQLRNRNYAKSPTFAAAYMNEAADELDRLSAELAEARKDAIRYRWLRADNAYYPEEQNVTGGEELDDLIDAAPQPKGE